MKLYQNGASAYMGGSGDHERAPRGEVKGWTAASARRQRQWLWSVASSGLTGHGYAVTLTLRDTPDDAVEFHRLRTNWIKRARRHGALRVHWVIEWQARGTPHLHAAVYSEQPLLHEGALLAVDWCALAGEFGAAWQSQDVKKIDGTIGWLKYLSKHASRGAKHYQRQGHPEGWDKSGRLWGHTGDWPVVEPLELPDLTNAEFWRVRRILRRWSEADARKAGDWGRLAYLRRAGRPDNARESRFIGVAEWVPREVTARLEDLLIEQGSSDSGAQDER